MEAIDKLINHLKKRFPKGKWNKVGDKIKKRYKEFKIISGGGKKRSKTPASIRGMTHAARAAIQRIMANGRARAETRFGPEAQEAFNRYINNIIGQAPPGARAQMTLLQRGANMARSTDYTDTQVQENLFNLFCQDYGRLDGILRQERSDRHRIDSDNWSRNAFMRYRIFISGLTFAFGIYASYWAYHRFNRPTAIAQELVESVLNIASYRHNQPSPNTEALPSPSPQPSPEQLQLPCSDGFFACGYNWARGQPSPSQVPEAPAELLALPAPNRTTVQAIGDWISNTAGSVLSSVTSSSKNVGGGLFYVFGSMVDIIEELVDLGAVLPGLAAGLITFLFFTIVSLAMLYGFSICGVGIIPAPDPPRGPPGPDKRPPPPPGPSGPKISARKPDFSAAMGKSRKTEFKFPTTAGGKRRRKRTKRKKRRTRKKTKRRRRKRKTKRKKRKRNYTKRQIGCNRRK